VTTAVQRDPTASARPQLWRVTDRHTFSALRQDGHRTRRGALSVTWLAPASDAVPAPPRVAFAIGRAAGGAVVRNRIRRRLRAALRDVQGRGALPAGTYLLGGSTELARVPWDTLLTDLGAAVAAATHQDVR
jgi:ribonuclease P protein component